MPKTRRQARLDPRKVNDKHMSKTPEARAVSASGSARPYPHAGVVGRPRSGRSFVESKSSMTPAQRHHIASTMGARTGGLVSVVDSMFHPKSAAARDIEKTATVRGESKVGVRPLLQRGSPVVRPRFEPTGRIGAAIEPTTEWSKPPESSSASVALTGRARKSAPVMRRGFIHHLDGAGGTKKRAVTIIKNKEYVTAITMAAFAPVNLALNPANVSLCPWLTGVAMLYDEFTWLSAKFTFRTEAATTERGRIMMALDYESSDSSPATRQQMEDLQGCTAFAPWQNGVLKYKPSSVQLPTYYCSAGGGPGDVRVTTPANFVYATSDGSNLSTSAGELWFEYEIAFLEANFITNSPTPPLLNYFATWVSVGTQAQQSATSATNGNGWNAPPGWFPYGNASGSYSSSMLVGGGWTYINSSAVNSLSITFPCVANASYTSFTPTVGSYLVTIYGNFSAGAVAPTFAYSGSISFHANVPGGGTFVSSLSAGSSYAYCARFDVAASPSTYVPALVLLGWNSAFSASNGCVVSVTRIPSVGTSLMKIGIPDPDVKDSTIGVIHRTVIDSCDGRVISDVKKSINVVPTRDPFDMKSDKDVKSLPPVSSRVNVPVAAQAPAVQRRSQSLSRKPPPSLVGGSQTGSSGYVHVQGSSETDDPRMTTGDLTP